MAENVSKKPPGKQPISRHPLFPATVALWFGALFGLGSLAIRPELLEQAVLALNLQLIVPAAAPPLGVTARILVALAMAGLGGVAGAVLARRLAQPKTETRKRKRNAASVAHVGEDHLSPFERAVAQGSLSETDANADGDVSADAHADVVPGNRPTGNRRRFLAGREEARGREPEDLAPIPGAPQSPPQILSVAEFDLEPFDQEPPRPVVIAQQDTVHEVQEAAFLRSLAAEHCDDEQALGAPHMIQNRAQAEEEARPGFTLFQRFVDTPAPQTAARPDDHGPVEQAPVSRDTPPAPVSSHSTGGRIASANLDDLSHVELLERLAMTMERRRQEAAAAAAPVPAPVLASVEPSPVESVAEQPPAAQTGPAEEGTSDPAPRIAAIPAALRPIGIEDDEADEDELLPSYVPPRHISMPRPLSNETDAAGDGTALDDAAGDSTVTALPFATRPRFRESQPGQGPAALDTVSEDDADALEEGYSSLLNLSRPAAARQQFVRIEEPEGEEGDIQPVVVFPGDFPDNQARLHDGPFSRCRPMPADATPSQASPSQRGDPGSTTEPLDNEQALRAALATLQRMSGTA